MPVNLIDPAEIDAFLRREAGEDPEIAAWLALALAKSLRRRPESAVEARELPPDAPEWLRKKWQGGGPFHDFRPDDELVRQVRHIRDWLLAARADEAPFLKRLDDTGAPLKLLNLDLASAMQAADKYFDRMNMLSGGADESAADLAAVMQLPGGYRVVRLLTPEALKVEGRKMGNCLGAQGHRLLNGEALYYSLRDARNEPHATLAHAPDKRLIECKGRQNLAVAGKYVPLIAAFLREMKISLDRAARDLQALLQDERGELHLLNELPSPFAWRDSLEFSDNDTLTRLPVDLTVQGNLVLRGCRNLAEAGSWLTVTGNLEVAGCGALRSLARETTVGGALTLDSCGLDSGLRGLKVRESVFITRCPVLLGIDTPLQLNHSLVIRNCARLKTLPPALSVGRDLEIRGCPALTRLPEGLRVGGRISTDFGVFTSVENARRAFQAQYRTP
jgi:hypothetical protein